jgi:hypothetical protein
MSKAGTPPKVDGISQMTGAQHTPFLQQVESVITDAGGTLIESDSLQFRQALNSYASIANFYIDTGTATEYVLNPQGAFKTPIDTPTTWNGMLIRFRPTNNNTGVATLRLAGLNGGLPFNILREDGTTIQAGDFSITRDAILRYDSTASAFLLLKVPNASQTVAGILKTSTTALVNAGNDDLTAITPLQLKTFLTSVTANSKTTNGWTYLSNGLILQWGIQNESTVGTFPITFPNACFCLQGSANVNAFLADSSVTTVSIISTSQFRVRCGTDGGSMLYWLAIGY